MPDASWLTAGARVERAHLGITKVRRFSGPVPYRWATPPQEKTPGPSRGFPTILCDSQITSNPASRNRRNSTMR
jgi:hypothetical protein